MKLYVLEVSLSERQYNIGKFRLTFEGSSHFSEEGDWTGSNGALLYLDQMSGYWQIANHSGNLKLLLLDHKDSKLVSFSLSPSPHIKISLRDDSHVLATLGIVRRTPLFLGAAGTGIIYKTLFLTYNFTYKVLERTF